MWIKRTDCMGAYNLEAFSMIGIYMQGNVPVLRGRLKWEKDYRTLAEFDSKEEAKEAWEKITGRMTGIGKKEEEADGEGHREKAES